MMDDVVVVVVVLLSFFSFQSHFTVSFLCARPKFEFVTDRTNAARGGFTVIVSVTY